ncbi:hypothetical protein CC80DRAFT_47891, partial [Byssothecium circinans]
FLHLQLLFRTHSNLQFHHTEHTSSFHIPNTATMTYPESSLAAKRHELDWESKRDVLTESYRKFLDGSRREWVSSVDAQDFQDFLLTPALQKQWKDLRPDSDFAMSRIETIATAACTKKYHAFFVDIAQELLRSKGWRTIDAFDIRKKLMKDVDMPRSHWNEVWPLTLENTEALRTKTNWGVKISLTTNLWCAYFHKDTETISEGLKCDSEFFLIVLGDPKHVYLRDTALNLKERLPEPSGDPRTLMNWAKDFHMFMVNIMIYLAEPSGEPEKSLEELRASVLKSMRVKQQHWERIWPSDWQAWCMKDPSRLVEPPSSPGIPAGCGSFC